MDDIAALLAAAGRVCGEDEREWAHFLQGLPPPVRRAIGEAWGWQAHDGQRVPGGDWTVWLLMAGRGFGKTRAGAEWVHMKARAAPGARIALVGASRDDAVRVMVEGPSGLIATAGAEEPVQWTPTRGQVEFAGGALGFLYSASAPETLRGPEHDFAWADELAKWGRPSPACAGASSGSGRAGSGEAAWDNLMMGLRLGDRPQVVVTTTPREGPLLKRVMALPGCAVTRGRTADNVHLPEAFIAWAKATYGGTRLGRQELDGELIEEVEGSLFPREMLEAARVPLILPGTGRGTMRSMVEGAASVEAPLRQHCVLPPPRPGEDLFSRIVVGVDPPASANGDACGIVVCGRAGDIIYVLADASVAGMRPEGWARKVAAAAAAWGADRVVAEKNQGGDMVEHVLRSADIMMPVKLVHASRGKAARAEPVAALFEAGRAKLAGRFPELEDELAGMLAGGGYAGPTRSPDRADACVWAMTALMRKPREPRVAAL